MYNVRLQLAILDHNHHTNRAYRESDGEKQLHRVWRHWTKRWDVILKKINKSFTYIPDILRDIFSTRAETHERICDIRGKKRTGSAITPVPPPESDQIAARKQSRFGH